MLQCLGPGVSELLANPGAVKKALLGMIAGTEGTGPVKASKLSSGFQFHVSLRLVVCEFALMGGMFFLSNVTFVEMLTGLSPAMSSCAFRISHMFVLVCQVEPAWR